MIVRLLDHARSNVIAYIALTMSMLALDGGAYAAVSLPSNSVGARQLRNHSVGASKLDGRSIGGAVRHWAQVDASGKIVASSGPARNSGVPPDGDYIITWSDTFPQGCTPIATVLGGARLLTPAVALPTFASPEAIPRACGSAPTARRVPPSRSRSRWL